MRALELIALYGDLFRPAANLLMLLAEAENERWTNNATGVFSGLFSLGPGQVAPTSLPPEARLPVLMSALSDTDLRAELALKAFDVSFAIRTITRWGGDEPFRLKDRVRRWSPTSYEEWHAAYRLYWRTLSAALERLQPRLRQSAGAILLSHARELLSVEALQDDVLTTLGYLGCSSDIDTRDVLETVDTILEFDKDGLPNEVVSELSRQREALIGTTYQSRLRRYVGMALLIDELDENAREESSRVLRELRLLAEESVRNPEEFRSELSWLVTREAKNGYRFGHIIGELDAKRLLWPYIVAAWQSAGARADDFFVGGYLRSVFERSVGEWENIIRQIAATDQNVDHVPGVVWRSGMSESIALLLINLVKSGKALPETLGVFSLGRATEGIPDRVFREWLETFLALGSWQSVSTALNLASMSLYSERKLDGALIARVLTHPALFHREDERNTVMLAHYWLRLAKALNQIEVNSELLLLRLLIETLGNRDAITGSLGPEGEKYLDELASRHPAETWRIASGLIKQPMDARTFAISRWLRGDMGFGKRSPGPLRYVPREEIWDWIARDSEVRAAYVANMAPKDFTPETWNDSLIRELLRRFGNDEKVRSAVFSNFFTGGWMGPASSHYAAQKEALSAIKASETDPNALRWISDALEALEREIEGAKVEEEARSF